MESIRTTRPRRPSLSIPLPKLDTTAGVEQDFLTPPIWVASNPPPLFERREMKRTVSELSSWGGDDDGKSMTSSSEHEGDKENEVTEKIVYRLCL
jgi:hypothetical protein